MFEQICWDTRDVFKLSPTQLYEEGNWYIILSCWVNLINEKGRELYESTDPKERVKRQIKKEVITRYVKKEEEFISASSHTTTTLEDKLNERNRKSIDKTHS